MREIGGYIELDTYTGNMLHDDGIKCFGLSHKSKKNQEIVHAEVYV